jgi:hypothetical protein
VAATGQSWSSVGWEWDLVRFEAWQKARGSLPILDRMVGAFMGYKTSEPEVDTSNMTEQQHAERLLGQLGFTGIT